MRFEYDPNFIEQATFLLAKRGAEHECVLHERLDPLYRITDVELRSRAFRKAYGELFQWFGLDRIVPRLVDEFSLMARRVPRCVIREAERNRAQNVDLYIREPSVAGADDERVLILALCPEALSDRERFTPWMRRQLQHVEDMVDEEFAYDTQLPGDSPVHQNLIRDRYGVLWDIYVEGRLIRSGKLGDSAVPDLWRSFSKSFTRGGVSPSRGGFEKLLAAKDLTHGRLLNWARNPDVLSRGGEEDAPDERAMVFAAE